MRLPPKIRERFRAFGRAGGRARAAGMAPETRIAIAGQAAIRRWIRARFGASSFDELGMPGGEMVDSGLADLAAARETVASLLVAEAAPRLRREGVPVPRRFIPDARERLYRELERRSAGLAHARFTALLRQMSSFADACAAWRRSRLDA